jgi:hypothetical protein
MVSASPSTSLSFESTARLTAGEFLTTEAISGAAVGASLSETTLRVTVAVALCALPS